MHRLLLIALLYAPAAGADWSLPLLEAELDQALSLRLARADTEIRLQQAERQRAESGWKLLGGALLSDNEEATGVGGTREFNAVSARVGLRYPLLGSRLEEQLALLRAETDLEIARSRERAVRRTALELLRRRYISYWSNQRRMTLARDYLDHEAPARNVLDKRRERGLLLESDRLEFVSGFALARRDHARFESQRADDLQAIALIAGQPIAAFVAPRPALPAPCLRKGPLLAAAGRHPEIEALAARIGERGDPRQFAGTLPIESGLNLSHTVVHERPEAITGSSNVLSVDLRMPLNLMAAARAQRSLAAAELSKARLEHQLRLQELRQSASRLRHQHRARRQGQRFAEARLAAAEARVRERTLRAERLAGDMLEQLQQARFAYYQTALESVEAEAALLDTEARLLALAPDGCALADPPAEDRAAPPRLGVYLWDAAAFLAGGGPPPALWRRVQARGIDRILLSLTGAQIRWVESPRGAQRLRGFIEQAAARDIAVELLLAEPTWILPAHRGELLAIISAMRGFPFSGLHLDLEPNQLEGRGWPEARLLDELLITLQRCTAASPWPVGFSVHPRYFAADTSSGNFGARLAALDLAEITLMVYVANPRRAREISAPLLARYPDTRFSLAQSIEDFLPPEETHAGRGLEEFGARMAELAGLFGERNFAGIVVQAWRYYRYMSP